MLPLVEFFLEDDITDEEALTLLDSEVPRKKEKDEWKETNLSSILDVEFSEVLSNLIKPPPGPSLGP